jgi:hypothetical protein
LRIGSFVGSFGGSFGSSVGSFGDFVGSFGDFAGLGGWCGAFLLFACFLAGQFGSGFGIGSGSSGGSGFVGQPPPFGLRCLLR